MTALEALYLAHPFWSWIALAAVLLAIEVATGSGYLLWPAASAAATALITGLHLGLPVELLIFAALTIVTTLLSRKYLPHPLRSRGPDINDQHQRLVGRRADAVGPFARGRGRVFIDGKEWAAELDGAQELAAGSQLEVVAVVSGGTLKVKAAA